MATAMRPSIPPRPAKSPDKGGNDDKAPPKIPPRPTRHLDRKISDDARFAPSPLNEGFPKNPKTTRFAPDDEVDKFSSEHHEPQERPGSVAMPSLGEEGAEYAAVAELQEPDDPEHTRTVGGDMKIHAPKPSLPVESAKRRVSAVTRIDSDRAASFGIGSKSVADASSLSGSRKKSITSNLSSEEGRDIDDESGIPEIGLRVPMYRDAGDVQAPSPGPQSISPGAGKGAKHHGRAGGQGGDHPPGSYGLHGHGHVSGDKLDKAYYEKHPDELQKELSRSHHDRQNDYAMSRKDLDNIVRETASRGGALDSQGTPSEEIGHLAHEEYASRVVHPHATSAAATSGAREDISPSTVPEQHEDGEKQDEYTIHVADPRTVVTDDSATEEHHGTPILADDEVANHPPRFELYPAVEPLFEIPEDTDGPTSRPSSRHSSRPTSAQMGASIPEYGTTPLEDVKEYEPLFDEESNNVEPAASPPTDGALTAPRFPSKDVWEDAPSSAHQTTEVNTPEPSAVRLKQAVLPGRSVPTPAQAFAKHQEDLAEKEAQRTKNFVPRGESKGSTWLPLQPLAVTPDQPEERASAPRGFPSRDVWEDAPESHLHETTVSSHQSPRSPPEQPEPPVHPSQRPAVPGRPRPKKTPSDEARPPKPAVSDRPKPHVPARPFKKPSLSPEEKEAPAPAKPKPAVPARPPGAKIAAFQSSFLSDLNKRLQLGPQAPNIEEPQVAAAGGGQEEEGAPRKMPLSDARKGRARGPQRRAPARSPAPPVVAAPVETARPEAPSLSLSAPQAVWSLDPEDSSLLVNEIGGGDAPELDAARGMSPREESPKVGRKAEASPTGDEPRGESVTEPGTEVKTEPKAEPTIEPEMKPKAEVETEPETLPAGDEPMTEPNAESPKSETKTDPEIEPKIEPEAEVKTDHEPLPAGDQPQDEPKTEPNTESPNAENPNVSPMEDIAEVATADYLSGDDASAEPADPGAEPLDGYCMETDRLGDLPSPAEGRSAPVLGDVVGEGDVEEASPVNM